MENSNTKNQVTTTTQGMQNSSIQGTPAMASQAMNNQAMNQTMASQMPGVQKVQQQVSELRQTLQDLMMNKQYADGEIITASAALDAQLQDYSRTLSDKKQPSMRTF